MTENPVGTVLEQVIRAAAGLVAGPMGLAISPILEATCVWAGEKLGDESEVGKVPTDALSHVFGHLGGEATRELLSSLQARGNHDLQRAVALAIKNALAEANQNLVGHPNFFLERFDTWFSAWDHHLAYSLKSSSSTTSLFNSDEPIDPIKLAAASEVDWWPDFKQLLFQWVPDRLSAKQFPKALDLYLGNELLNLTRQAVLEVVSDETHQLGLIAWQQRLFEEIAKQLSETDPGLAELFGRLTVQLDHIEDYLPYIRSRVDIFRDRRFAQCWLGPYATVPPLPRNYIDRKDALDNLRDLVLSGSGPVSLTSLEGMGGVGKTVLAIALCQDSDVRSRFRDRIVWLDIGKESGLNSQDRLAKALRALNVQPGEWDSTDVKDQFRSALAEKETLIILDDVWSAADVEPFIPDSSRSHLVFTTRAATMGNDFGAASLTIETLSNEKSRGFIAGWSGRDTRTLPTVADEILAECNGLPLALAMLGASLLGSPDEDWNEKLESLRDARPKYISGDLGRYKYEYLHAAIKVCIDGLDENTRKRYFQLAVLLEDMVAPLFVLQVLWGVEESEAKRTVRDLETRCLVQRDQEGLRIHDLQLDYIRARHPDVEALRLIHGALRLSAHTISWDQREFISQLSAVTLTTRPSTGIKRGSGY